MNPTQIRQLKAFKKRAKAAPEFFVRNGLGDTPEDYQVKIMHSVRDHPITTVRSCHDTGKSFT